MAGGQRADEAENYRPLYLSQFEQADRLRDNSVGFVQDPDLQTRDRDVKKLLQEEC